MWGFPIPDMDPGHSTNPVLQKTIAEIPSPPPPPPSAPAPKKPSVWGIPLPDLDPAKSTNPVLKKAVEDKVNRVALDKLNQASFWETNKTMIYGIIAAIIALFVIIYLHKRGVF